jgi:hypothetical protein
MKRSVYSTRDWVVGIGLYLAIVVGAIALHVLTS